MNEICAICGEEIFADEPSTVFLNFKPVHVRCDREALQPEKACEYAEAWYTDFFEYLKETLTCTSHPEEQAAARMILEDFRDNWGGQQRFPDWIADNY